MNLADETRPVAVDIRVNKRSILFILLNPRVLIDVRGWGAAAIKRPQKMLTRVIFG